MDVLVDYTDAADNKVAARLQHGADWSISSITPDERDPNLWNSAETADTGGNGDGFESSPTDAVADDNNAASSLTLLLSGDRHRFYD